MNINNQKVDFNLLIFFTKILKVLALNNFFYSSKYVIETESKKFSNKYLINPNYIMKFIFLSKNKK